MKIYQEVLSHQAESGDKYFIVFGVEISVEVQEEKHNDYYGKHKNDLGWSGNVCGMRDRGVGIYLERRW